MFKNIELNNASRLESLQRLGVLDSGAEKVYDDITQLIAEICEVPMCLISLVEEDRQWFKSEVGLGLPETHIQQSICAFAVQQNAYLEINDTQADSRTVNNSLCQGDTPVRFYAGAILRTLEGWPMGTLCVLDYKPRRLSEFQKRALIVHANSVTRQLELTRNIVETVGVFANESNLALSEEEQRLIEQTRADFKTLTRREAEILKFIAGNTKSLSSKEIARELGISHRTVHHHRANIMKKMNVNSVAELISGSIKAKVFH